LVLTVVFRFLLLLLLLLLIGRRLLLTRSIALGKRSDGGC